MTTNKTTLKGIGDKRTKECRGCYNTSQFICFKCRQQRARVDKGEGRE